MDSADESSRKLLENEVPEPPEYYVLYRKLKMWAGDGQIPFMWGDGYMGQPWLATQAIEQCMSAERDYKALVKAQNEQQIQASNQEVRNQP